MKMIESIQYFTADFRDGRVYLGGKARDAGYYAAQLLNQYYLNDTAARISVYSDNINFNIVRQLEDGYLNISEYVATGRNVLEAMKALPQLHPFDTLDISVLTFCVTDIFTEENGECICRYFSEKAKVSLLRQAEVAVGTAYRFAERTDKSAEALIENVIAVLTFFNNISDDLTTAHKKLTAFVKRLDEAERFDEKHLLPIALEVFGSIPFPVTTEYISLKKNKASSGETVARHLTFDRYIAFVLTDFFEGLHYGHYPRQCQMCRRYFVMTSARQTMYCNGWATELWRGKRITCRNLAAQQKRKEYAANNPVSVIYNTRCSAIRVEEGRGTITKDFAAAAKALAKEHKQRADADPEYAAKQYAADMERAKLYEDTDRQMK